MGILNALALAVGAVASAVTVLVGGMQLWNTLHEQKHKNSENPETKEVKKKPPTSDGPTAA